MGILSKLFGDANKSFLNSLKPQIEAINNLADNYHKLSDTELIKRTQEWALQILNDKKYLKDKNFINLLSKLKTEIHLE